MALTFAAAAADAAAAAAAAVPHHKLWAEPMSPNFLFQCLLHVDIEKALKKASPAATS